MTDILAPRSKSVRGHPREDHLLKASKQQPRQPGLVGMSIQNAGDVKHSDRNAIQGVTTFCKEYLFIHPQCMDDMNRQSLLKMFTPYAAPPLDYLSPQ